MKQHQKAIIFDLVGVVFSIDKIKPLRKLGILKAVSFYLRYRANPLDYALSLLDKMRKEVPGEYQDFLMLQGTYLPQSVNLWQRGLLSTKETFEKIFEFFFKLDQKTFKKNQDKELLLTLFNIMFDSKLGAQFLVPNKIIVETINQLRKNNKHHLFVLSNMDTETYDAIVTLYPSIFNLFDGIVTSFNTQKLKPKPDIFLHLLNTYNLNPSLCYFIDDQPENIITAKKLGMHALLCKRPSTIVKQLNALKLL